MRAFCLALCLLPLANRLCAADAPGPGAPAANVDYVKQVKPLFAARCASCHGALKQKAGLRLDVGALLLKGGKDGPVIVPGNSGDSRLIHAVTGTHGVDRMPEEGPPLADAGIVILRDWIDQGAKVPSDEPVPSDPLRHWSFSPPVRPELPGVKNAVWVRNPVDAFIAAEHEKRGLAPRPEAAKHVLLRRVYLDLIGLPPTREQLHAFLKDTSPDAYEKVVDQLLASPQHGERWGRHWMDVWRYSDWAGFAAEVRESQPFVWRWRDWIIDSLNADKPYDRMVQEMLAADELAPDDSQALRATGYLVRNWYKFNRNVWLDNTVEHTGKAFLGLTLNCAKCHDHMYDPISQKEVYQFRAFFEPHNVRTDRLPGQPDVSKDGLARVYDADAGKKTFLFVRGEEKSPDEANPLAPAVPAALAGPPPLDVRPVALTPGAYYPGLQPFIQQETLAAAGAAVTQAESALAQADKATVEAQTQLAAVTAKLAAPARAAGVAEAESPPAAFLADDFAAARSDLWKIGVGQWEYKDGRLHQLQAGAEERPLVSLAEHPPDLRATLKYKITGGQQWCSVGLSFDVTEARSANSVYLSAHAGGPGVAIFYRQGGSPVYPSNNMVPAPIKLGTEYTLRVEVRGRLVNVFVNDALVMAYRTMLARAPGKFSVWAFDATAEFLNARVETLPADAKLVEPGGSPPAEVPWQFLNPADEFTAASAAARQAQSAAELAKLQLGAARAEKAATAARIAADNAKYATPPAANAETLALAAGRAEREAALWGGEIATLQAEHALIAARLAFKLGDDAATKALAAAEAKVTEQRTNVFSVRSAVNKPSPAYTALGTVYPSASTGRRLGLAKWITGRHNPLAARVAVNHMWARHFGDAIVPTVFDFGLNGKPPTNPALLDWLAIELMERGWSMKAVHRLMVTSAAYRMDSGDAGPADPNRKLDPDNRHLWRTNARRMEAEVVRDSVLHVASKLDPAIGGPELDHEAGQTSGRRSLYFRHAHEKQMTFLKLFDAASPNECYRRDRSVMPQQALALANSPLALAQARVLAAELTQQAGPPPGAAATAAFITAAFEQTLSRPPTDAERETCGRFLTEQAARLADPTKLSAFTSGDAPAVAPSADPVQRARENLVHVLLNHNDFVMIR